MYCNIPCSPRAIEMPSSFFNWLVWHPNPRPNIRSNVEMFDHFYLWYALCSLLLMRAQKLDSIRRYCFFSISNKLWPQNFALLVNCQIVTTTVGVAVPVVIVVVVFYMMVTPGAKPIMKTKIHDHKLPPVTAAAHCSPALELIPLLHCSFDWFQKFILSHQSNNQWFENK